MLLQIQSKRTGAFLAPSDKVDVRAGHYQPKNGRRGDHHACIDHSWHDEAGQGIWKGALAAGGAEKENKSMDRAHRLRSLPLSLSCCFVTRSSRRVRESSSTVGKRERNCTRRKNSATRSSKKEIHPYVLVIMLPAEKTNYWHIQN